LDIPLSGDCELDLIIYRAGERQGVDPRFIYAVIQQESRYDAKAVSGAGARGLMQLIPATAKRFHCDDPHDKACNVEAGTKYLAWLLKRFNGDVELALAGYNAGEGAVVKYQGVPPYSETRNYVRRVVANYGKTYHPVLSAENAKIEFRLNVKLAPNKPHTRSQDSVQIKAVGSYGHVAASHCEPATLFAAPHFNV
jgi:hypothetical protein